MLDVVGKHRKETEILDIFSQIQEVKDTESIEYKKLVQKICNPIWNWVLICFREEDVRNAGVEIFHCIKRTILNYQENTSYIGFLYASIKNEIRHKKEKGEVSKFRMCTRDEYNRAVKLISSAQKFGKDPLSTNVQAWLAEQSGLSVEAIKDLISKYYRSQVVEEQIQIRENEEKKISIFETDAVHNNYLTPEQEVFKIESALDDLAIIEQVFDERQERQKKYLSSFITLRILQIYEKVFLIEQIVKLLQNRTFLDIDLLSIFISHKEMPTQCELAAKYGKDEGYISNRIKDFFEKVQKKISS